MARPPEAKPNSDIDGVHQDERRNTDVAAEIGDDAGDLEDARKKSVGRPPYSEGTGRDDRTG